LIAEILIDVSFFGVILPPIGNKNSDEEGFAITGNALEDEVEVGDVPS